MYPSIAFLAFTSSALSKKSCVSSAVSGAGTTPDSKPTVETSFFSSTYQGILAESDDEDVDE